MIELDTYKIILDLMPIICVDAVVLSNKGVLFLKRRNEPAKNEWWFPGGRLQKNERLEVAVVRKIQEECNIKVNLEKFLGVSQTIFETGMYNIQTHTVNFTFLLTTDDTDIQIDKDHESYIWSFEFNKLNLNTDILDILKNNNINDKYFV